ncbi:LOW QUALITY PROTEIN: Butyrophilin-like protein 2 [Galemys pyrenaicus]|uniref:Butyrophilin-like protein 2 n=1 Tax=Galemys pyrenaicus TaxID=202257 RepID=A0A8J6AN09_GALPY|nr:LOW QUALITY PROTEIN: Butyrophilin-like protein 2 [Galemys pyrenaicus]
MDAQKMEVRCTEAILLVHHYGASQDYMARQMSAYQGRTEFLKENITKGQVALKIHSIYPSDDGKYKCSFQSSTYYNKVLFKVLVTGSGAAPHIHIEPGNTKEVKLTCTSMGWFPEPERDLQGQHLAPDSEIKTEEGTGLFHVETSIIADEILSGAVSCFIRNPVLNEEKEVHKSVAGQFHVIGPKEPIIAKAGEDAVLSCHLNPVMNAQNMEVKWYRNHSSALVHCYGASQDHKEQQMPEYQGRTGFLKENITKGQASLRIHSIRPSDGGEYSCFFESSTYYDDSIFEVLVTGSGAAPHIHVEPGNTRKVKLTCTSTGWYPEPEVQWRDLKGQLVVPDAETKTTEANGLFHVETFVTVDKSSSGAVSCLVRNPILNEEKEVYISVAGNFLQSQYPEIALLIKKV